MKPDYFEQRIFQEAMREVPLVAPGEDKRQNRVALREAIKTRLPTLTKQQLEQMKEKQAEEIIQACEQPGKTEVRGQLTLPFAEGRADYEPFKVLPDDDGNVIQQRHATLRFKEIEAQNEVAREERAKRRIERAQDNLVEQVKRRRQAQIEREAFAEWHIREYRKGRPAFELTFQAFLIESGYLNGPPPPDGD
jgi:hypothetical protein